MHKKIVLLKKKELERHSMARPWNQDVMLALLKKYQAKKKVKTKNRQLILRLILRFLAAQENSDCSIGEKIWREINEAIKNLALSSASLEELVKTAQVTMKGASKEFSVSIDQIKSYTLGSLILKNLNLVRQTATA